MQVVHRPADGSAQSSDRVIARDVDVADSLLAQTRGLMFRTGVPDDYAMVFRFHRAKPRTFHMVFVPFPLDVVWLFDGKVTAVERLRPWIGFGRATADTVIELPAGAAQGVEPGDVVTIEE